jgi:transaldolase
VAAAKILKEDGIDTLGTCLFNIYQAVAASQVGQYAVSMYLNEPRAWLDAKAWDDVEIPATQHPMGARHARIRVTYDQLAETTGKRQPHMKTASYVEFCTRMPLGISS